MRITRQRSKLKTVQTNGGTPATRTTFRASTHTSVIRGGEGTASGHLTMASPTVSSIIYGETGVTVPVATVRTSRSGRPSTAHEWVLRNTKKVQAHKGEWIAIAPNGIVATSDNLDSVYVKAKNLGIANPLVFKVPRTRSHRKVVSGKL